MSTVERLVGGLLPRSPALRAGWPPLGAGSQRIPRPPGATPGPVRVWNDATAVSLAQVIERVCRVADDAEIWPSPARSPSPGHLLVRPHASSPARPPVSGSVPERSAVLVALFAAGEEGEVRVLLTRRASSLSTHAGEVAFPGGRADAAELPTEAALREAAEEVGLDRTAVRRILGSLAPVTTSRATALVVPVVGILSGPPALRSNPSEVARVFDVALVSLARPGVFREERWPLPDGGDRRIDFFEVAGETIWGATARVLRGLLTAVFGPPEVDPEGGRRASGDRDAAEDRLAEDDQAAAGGGLSVGRASASAAAEPTQPGGACLGGESGG